MSLCDDCAATLRVVLREKGEEALGRAVGEVLCGKCRAQLPGYGPDRELTTSLKPAPKTCVANIAPTGDVDKSQNMLQWAVAMLRRGYEECGQGATHITLPDERALCQVHAEAARVALRNPDCVANMLLGRGRTEDEIANLVRPLEDVS